MSDTRAAQALIDSMKARGLTVIKADTETGLGVLASFDCTSLPTEQDAARMLNLQASLLAVLTIEDARPAKRLPHH